MNRLKRWFRSEVDKSVGRNRDLQRLNDRMIDMETRIRRLVKEVDELITKVDELKRP